MTCSNDLYNAWQPFAGNNTGDNRYYYYPVHFYSAQSPTVKRRYGESENNERNGHVKIIESIYEGEAGYGIIQD